MADENLTNEEQQDSSPDDLTEEQLISLPDDEFMDYMNAKTNGTAIRAKHPEFVGDEIKDPDSKIDEGNEDSPESSDDDSGVQQEEQAGESKEETLKEPEQPSEEQPAEPTIDYKAAYESIMRPFKANGREITPNGIGDVISLMQMGANYTKKMQQFAPVRKIAETVTRNGIDNDELNLLIDAHNGNKDAIKSLLKRHNIEPTDIMSDGDDSNTLYTPANHTPSDADMAFSEVVADIAPESMEKIKDIITNKWDAKSKEQLLNDPNILRGLNEEVEMGRFDKIQAVIENERVFGRHKDMSDLDLYIAVVTEYDKAQRQYAQQQYQQQVQQQQRSQATTPIPDKTKAAPTTKSRAQSRGRIRDSEIFKMSDEDFAKLKPGDILFNE